MDEPRSGFSRRSLLADVAAGVVLIGLTVAYMLLCVSWSGHPFEDAAILMRYAQHLGQGGGFVWNVGQPPVDGATDFLLVVMAGGLVAVGLSAELAVVSLAMGAHFVTGLLIYGMSRRLYGLARPVAMLLALFVLLGPGVRYIAAGFGTSVFALAAVGCWYLSVRLVERPGRWSRAVCFALACLAMSLVRPEGVFMSALMVAAMAWKVGLVRMRRALVAFGLVFAILGGGFFLWRWNYFGHPLPNPFYRKGGGSIYLDGLSTSVRTVFGYCMPLGLLWLVKIRSCWRDFVFLLIPAGGFTLIWILLSPEMNYMGRFQYPVVVLATAGGAAALKCLMEAAPATGKGIVSGILCAVIVLSILCQQFMIRRRLDNSGWAGRGDGRYDVAMILREYSDQGYVLATTEAGLLPFYSRWETIDTWGLNDSWIAQNGTVTEAYLDQHRPAVLMIHAVVTAPPKWKAMTETLQTYAQDRDYRLAGRFGLSPQDVHEYWVREDMTDCGAICRAIAELPYMWFSTGQPVAQQPNIPSEIEKHDRMKKQSLRVKVLYEGGYVSHCQLRD
jgi:arabinofuranosyltransferase